MNSTDLYDELERAEADLIKAFKEFMKLYDKINGSTNK